MLVRLSLLILMVTVSASAQWGPCGAKKDEVRQMGRRVEKELPLGSTVSQVAKFLDDMQLVHGQPSRVYGGPRRYRKLRGIGATIETPAHNEPAIWLTFYFDKRGKLVESVVTNACGLGCYSIRRNRPAVLRDTCF
jgi:hypothetical protein